MTTGAKDIGKVRSGRSSSLSALDHTIGPVSHHLSISSVHGSAMEPDVMQYSVCKSSLLKLPTTIEIRHLDIVRDRMGKSHHPIVLSGSTWLVSKWKRRKLSAWGFKRVEASFLALSFPYSLSFQPEVFHARPNCRHCSFKSQSFCPKDFPLVATAQLIRPHFGPRCPQCSTLDSRTVGFTSRSSLSSLGSRLPDTSVSKANTVTETTSCRIRPNSEHVSTLLP